MVLASLTSADWFNGVMTGTVGVIITGVIYVIFRRFTLVEQRKLPQPILPSRASRGVAVGPSRQDEPAPRRRGNPVPVTITNGADERPGTVVDRSPEGLGIRSDVEYAAGAILRVRAARADQSMPAVAVQVRQCRKDAIDFYVNCEFVQPPVFNIMLQFG